MVTAGAHAFLGPECPKLLSSQTDFRMLMSWDLVEDMVTLEIPALASLLISESLVGKTGLLLGHYQNAV